MSNTVVCYHCKHNPTTHRSDGCSAAHVDGGKRCGCADYTPCVVSEDAIAKALRSPQEMQEAVEVPDQAPEALGDTTEGRGDPSGTCPNPKGCDSCPNPQYCRGLRVGIGITTVEQEGRGEAFEELAAWWREYAETEIEGVVPKAVEYGSGDLAAIGRDLAQFHGISEVISEQRATELGIFFYARGKLARWFDAILHERECSLDTLHDLGIYTKMAIRNRQVGGWPGLEAR